MTTSRPNAIALLPSVALMAFGVAGLLMTLDPLLDVPWAAAAWTFTLRSRCFEAEISKTFVIQHMGKGPGNVCADGRG